MLGTLATVLIIVLVGGRARDNLRLRQQEVILGKLAEADAVAYYDVLRRRVRNARILRAVTLFSLLCIFYAWRHGLSDIFRKEPIHPRTQTNLIEGRERDDRMSDVIEPVDPGVLREIHRSMIDLWQRGYELPIRWTLASFGNPTVIVSGKTAENKDSARIATTTSDGSDLPSSFPLPARLVATDARGLSITGLVPWTPDRVA